MPEWSARGRAFEDAELPGWPNTEQEPVAPQVAVRLASGRKGRIDVLKTLDDGSVVVSELKATEWDRIADRRVRPNLSRHIRQLMRYCESYWQRGIATHPALVYQHPPSCSERRAAIHDIANSVGVQVVWRTEDADGTRAFNESFDRAEPGAYHVPG